MNVQSTLDLIAPGAVMGKHAAWLPHVEIKVPFQFGGRIQKYCHPHEPAYDRSSIAVEIAILRMLAEKGLAPPIGDMVFFESVISQHLGALWIDPCGAYGYEMCDARRLPHGPVTSEAVADLRRDGVLVGSDGAWSDLLLESRENIVNGYIIDVRRTAWDMFRFSGPVAPLPDIPEKNLHVLLRTDGAFPFRARELPYQDYWLRDQWFPGEREVPDRARLLGFLPSVGESVLDLGCCTGGFLQFASLLGASRVVGLDTQDEFLRLAQDIARVNNMNYCACMTNLAVPSLSLVRWLNDLFPQEIDHLLCLSMGKHISEASMWWWIDQLPARHVYIETNAIDPAAPPESWHHWAGVMARGGRHVGFSRDRNVRALYRIDR